MRKRARMQQWFGWSAVVLGAAVWLTPASLEAAGRRLRPMARVPARAPDHDRNLDAPVSARPRSNPYEYYRSVYPKFYAGFHEHDYSNFGMPTGDVGLRGNGFYLPAW